LIPFSRAAERESGWTYGLLGDQSTFAFARSKHAAVSGRFRLETGTRGQGAHGKCSQAASRDATEWEVGELPPASLIGSRYGGSFP